MGVDGRGCVDVRVCVDVWRRVVVCLWAVSVWCVWVGFGCVCAHVCVIRTHERVTECPYCTHSTAAQSIKLSMPVRAFSHWLSNTEIELQESASRSGEPLGVSFDGFLCLIGVITFPSC